MKTRERGLTRRAVLLSSGAALLAAGPAQQIVDTHIHLYDPTRPQGVPWPSKTDAVLYKPILPETYAKLVRPLGVTGTIVVEASGWLEDNQWILDLARDHPMILGFVGHLEPGTPEFRQHLARFGRNPLFRGIRLNGNTITAGVSREAFLDDLRRLADAGLMMDAIGSASMLPSLLQVTAKVANLRIAIDHMPSEPPGWTERRGELRQLAKSPRVYAKISGVIGHADLLDEVWELFSPDRVMYGSNWPVSDKVAPYPEVLKVMKEYVAKKDAPAREKYFWRNSQTCYGWTDRV
jgi:L-fuconolactonase